jgi:hypothetical protein
MNNYAMQSASFETEKNLKASGYTVAICGLLALLFFYLQWDMPQTQTPVLDTGIEVNLGNSETGLGDIAPQLPGTPSNANETNVSPPPSSAVTQPKQNIAADENGDEEVNNATKVVKPEVKPKPFVNIPTTVKRHSENTVAAPAPKPVMPKALYKGGTTNGNGGNYADSYNGVKNQGIAGGNGDQGKPNGNPNSDSYTGNGGTGKSGVSIRSGLDGRRFTHLPSFEDDFNEPAKVAVDIIVAANGAVTSATINPRGTTTTNANIRAIAIRKAKQLKLNAGKDEEQTGTIVFDFKLRG